jgi:hypothetical protein
VGISSSNFVRSHENNGLIEAYGTTPLVEKSAAEGYLRISLKPPKMKQKRRSPVTRSDTVGDYLEATAVQAVFCLYEFY